MRNRESGIEVQGHYIIKSKRAENEPQPSNFRISS
jgi:hypothetical protein